MVKTSPGAAVVPGTTTGPFAAAGAAVHPAGPAAAGVVATPQAASHNVANSGPGALRAATRALDEEPDRRPGMDDGEQPCAGATTALVGDGKVECTTRCCPRV